MVRNYIESIYLPISMNPDNLNEWFGLSLQHKYVSQLQGRVGLTRRRAEYFVKLWAYLLLKQQYELGRRLQPVTKLALPEGFVACTHREAQSVFYGDSDRGSDRAAGMMIDKLVGLGLIEKKFDGNNICIRVKPLLPNLNSVVDNSTIDLFPDAFNPRVDTIPVATFVARYYNWIDSKYAVVPHRIARILREWAVTYPKGMRVLRRSDTQNAVAFYMLYPVAKESEGNFFISPRKFLYLGIDVDIDVDPMKMAPPQDVNCTAINVRGWQIDFPYKTKDNIDMLLRDAQNTLVQMQYDYPNLCDIYIIPLHPEDQQLAYALGFQDITQDPQTSLKWLYIALDKYLAINIEQHLSNLN